jgi:hypothetical protein
MLTFLHLLDFLFPHQTVVLSCNLTPQMEQRGGKMM